MSVTSTGSDPSGIGALHNRFKQFRSGEVKISKEDLEKRKAELSAAGKKTDRVDSMLANYDSIDTNGDGIGFDELKTYGKDKLPCGPRGAGGGDGPPLPDGGKAAPKALSQEDLTALRDRLSAQGESTATLDAVLNNFSAADKNSDGKVSQDELQGYAKAIGMNVPAHRHHHHRPPAAPDDQAADGAVPDTGTVTATTSVVA